MSAIGSVIVICVVLSSAVSGWPDLQRSVWSWCSGRSGSPAGLGDARELTAVGHLAQADPAQAELAIDRLGTAAALAAGVAANGELGLAGLLHLQGGLRHVSSPCSAQFPLSR